MKRSLLFTTAVLEARGTDPPGLDPTYPNANATPNANPYRPLNANLHLRPVAPNFLNGHCDHVLTQDCQRWPIKTREMRFVDQASKSTESEPTCG